MRLILAAFAALAILCLPALAAPSQAPTCGLENRGGDVCELARDVILVAQVDTDGAGGGEGVPPVRDTVVTFPYGDILAAIIGLVGSVLVILVGIALTFLVRFLPPWAQAIITTAQLEKIQALAADAIEYGVQATAGAVKGKELEINVGNELIANAVQNAIDTWEPKLVDALGSDGIKLEIIKRLENSGIMLKADSTIAKVMASPEVRSVNP